MKWRRKWEQNKTKQNKILLIQFSAPITINFPQDEDIDNLCDAILTLLLQPS